MTKKINKTDKEWKDILSPEAFQVTRKHGTERAFSGEYHDCKSNGVYACICCEAPLFSSEDKFDSGTGWPSFTRSIDRDCVESKEDNSLFMRRVEVLCSSCDAHLGHVFDDGPEPTGKRYCINSVSLNFIQT